MTITISSFFDPPWSQFHRPLLLLRYAPRPSGMPVIWYGGWVSLPVPGTVSPTERIGSTTTPGATGCRYDGFPVSNVGPPWLAPATPTNAIATSVVSAAAPMNAFLIPLPLLEVIAGGVSRRNQP